MSVINATPLLLGGEGYQISRSVRLRSSAAAYFNRTPASAGSLTTWTLSGWVKRGALTSGGNFTLFSAGSAAQPYTLISFTSDQLAFDCINAGSVVVGRRYTNQVFRDPSAWYHLVFVWDTTNATAASRMRMYVNGVQVTSFSLSSDPALNATTQANTTVAHYFGEYPAGGNYLDGYLTEVNFIDGQALTPASFGETDSITGVWKPKKYAGTYGTNGFYLNFSDHSAATAAAIGKDSSGNGNNWTPNNISLAAGATYDSMLDVPTMWADGGNGRGNYAVLNPLEARSNRITPTDGNMSAQLATGANAFFGAKGAIGVNTGKWYWEVNIGARDAGAGAWMGVGVVFETVNWPAGNGLGANSGGYEYLNDGSKWGAGTQTGGYGATWTTNDVVGVAFDADAQTLTFYKNGVSQGTAFTSIGSGGAWFPSVEIYRSTGTAQALFPNFGQRPFAYTPPSGFKALNTQNLPEPTIKKGNQYFDATTYPGTGVNGRSVANTGAMQPDLVWIKARNAAYYHVLFDSVRGTNKQLSSNATDAETTSSVYGYVSSFNADGFSVWGGSTDDLNVNDPSNNYVAWQWKESPSAGFDIVTYSGTGSSQSVAHSLGVQPSMVIEKRLNAGTNWYVYFPRLDRYFEGLNTTSAGATNVSSQITFSSSTGTINNVLDHGASGGNYVWYLFAEVAGFSKFGSYTGNGSADGPFQYLGFAPAFIMLKRTDSTGNWAMYDRARSPKNADTKVLYPNLSNTEDASTDHFDWLSNGFKMKSTNQNTSGGTFIYAAFAENPFKNSLAR